MPKHRQLSSPTIIKWAVFGLTSLETAFNSIGGNILGSFTMNCLRQFSSNRALPAAANGHEFKVMKKRARDFP